MTTFLKEVAEESTWMLPLEVGCINDGNKRIVASKGATGSRFKMEKQKHEKVRQVSMQ
jgi:hypothetical protein